MRVERHNTFQTFKIEKINADISSTQRSIKQISSSPMQHSSSINTTITRATQYVHTLDTHGPYLPSVDPRLCVFRGRFVAVLANPVPDYCSPLYHTNSQNRVLLLLLSAFTQPSNRRASRTATTRRHRCRLARRYTTFLTIR